MIKNGFTGPISYRVFREKGPCRVFMQACRLSSRSLFQAFRLWGKLRRIGQRCGEQRAKKRAFPYYLKAWDKLKLSEYCLQAVGTTSEHTISNRASCQISLRTCKTDLGLISQQSKYTQFSTVKSALLLFRFYIFINDQILYYKIRYFFFVTMVFANILNLFNDIANKIV